MLLAGGTAAILVSAQLMASAAYLISKCICHALFLVVSRRHVLHLDRARRRGPWILAANHISHFDPPLLTTIAPVWVNWMAMSDLFAMRFLGPWLSWCGCFPVQRFKADRNALRLAIERLSMIRVVGTFPEGGVRDGDASVLGGAPLRRGIRAAAEIGKVPIVPCVILGTDRLYRRANWRPLRRVPVWIGFGEAIQAADGTDLD